MIQTGVPGLDDVLFYLLRQVNGGRDSGPDSITFANSVIWLINGQRQWFDSLHLHIRAHVVFSFTRFVYDFADKPDVVEKCLGLIFSILKTPLFFDIVSIMGSVCSLFYSRTMFDFWWNVPIESQN